jgi:hypothetical protein
MLVNGPLDAIPLWAMFPLTVAIVLAAIEMGHQLGQRRRARNPQGELSIGAMVGPTLGLLAFILGFTFSFASQRVDTRRAALIGEANALGTTYRRADLLPEPHRSEIRDLLRQDVDTQLEVARTTDLAVLGRVDTIHSQLWQHAAALGRDNPNSIMVGLFIQSLNVIIEEEARRLFSVRTRISGTVWAVLYTLAALAMGSLGYEIGLGEKRRSFGALLMAVSFSLVIWLVANLDRPHEGSVRVSQQSMLDLQAMMHDTGTPR